MFGAGGVGSAFAPIAARRDFYEHIVFADIEEAKARSIVDRYDPGGKFSAAAIDATDVTQIADCARANDCDARIARAGSNGSTELPADPRSRSAGHPA